MKKSQFFAFVLITALSVNSSVFGNGVSGRDPNYDPKYDPNIYAEYNEDDPNISRCEQTLLDHSTVSDGLIVSAMSAGFISVSISAILNSLTGSFDSSSTPFFNKINGKRTIAPVYLEIGVNFAKGAAISFGVSFAIGGLVSLYLNLKPREVLKIIRDGRNGGGENLNLLVSIIQKELQNPLLLAKMVEVGLSSQHKYSPKTYDEENVRLTLIEVINEMINSDGRDCMYFERLKKSLINKTIIKQIEKYNPTWRLERISPI